MDFITKAFIAWSFLWRPERRQRGVSNALHDLMNTSRSGICILASASSVLLVHPLPGGCPQRGGARTMPWRWLPSGWRRPPWPGLCICDYAKSTPRTFALRCNLVSTLRPDSSAPLSIGVDAGITNFITLSGRRLPTLSASRLGILLTEEPDPHDAMSRAPCHYAATACRNRGYTA